MAIHTVCPACRFPYVLGNELGGELFTCTSCQTEFQLPQPVPEALPPVEMTAQYRRVVGVRRPVMLVLLGLGTLEEDMEQGVGRAVWNLRHLFGFLSLIIVTVIFAGTQESALRAGPAFFGLTVICFLAGYLIAVGIGHRELGESSKQVNVLNRLFMQPILLLMADARTAMPALRILFIGCCLGIGTLLMGMRAGSLNSVIPHPSLTLGIPQRASAHSTAGPESPTGVALFPETPDNSAADGTKATEPAPQSVTKPSNPQAQTTAPAPPSSPPSAYTSPPPPPAE